ncbi:MAG TPA: 6,7-dimethyl-8-ribityllumazine synthase [Candidatus Sumerlaeota bacterium]|nr:MAG: 6,7-dimethyl-8-ribityllumazine synthase [candidate division BRC1 bacterium ADurb.BinA292]HOE96425.1 6,7-dimethyl-8-ribityllumazine synthase [Candidatus Sumerlaeota bacterium]HOR26802.1 6,7-dimethyl-8-ribityllumazine synthase [Candidatus Sumerlaeota bacterium]HPK01456.1 6,7-dimethyl-8-ribityllumazine synthase [Candidatus Sumerlaeota bacterium]
MQVLEGDYDARGLRLALVASRFNEFIVGKLVEGALDAFVRHGGDPGAVTLAWVPGSLELPPVLARLAQSGRFDAVIALGCVIRGGTDHYTYVAGEAAKGVAQVALNSAVPVIFGVLTVDSIEQAIERAGTKMGNKGADAAVAAIEMARLYARLPGAKTGKA